MLFRTDGETVIAIPQPSHAWLAGQIVRAWGNERFLRPSPYEEVCLGAEQHDIAWLAWEAAPTWNPEHRPAARVPGAARRAPRRRTGGGACGALAAYGRYPALLVSLHANTIYASLVEQRRAAPGGHRGDLRALLAEQHAFQRAMREALAAGPRYARRRRRRRRSSAIGCWWQPPTACRSRSAAA